MADEIVFLIHDLVGGGAEAAMLDLALEMRDRGWKISIVTILHRGALLSGAIEKGLSPDSIIGGNFLGAAHFLRLFLRGMGARVRKFGLLIAGNRAQASEENTVLIHGFLYWGNILARLLGFLSGYPVVNSLRSTDLWRRKGHQLLDTLTSDFMDLYIPNSEAGRGRLLTLERIPSRKIRVVKNGLRRSMVPLEESELRTLSCGAAPKIGFAGRLSQVKNPILAVRAMAFLRDTFPGAVLQVAGVGPLRQSMEEEAARLKISDGLHFLEYVSDMEAFYDSLDLLLMTSEWEGFPNVVLEAMARGVPVVTTDCGGVLELVVHEGTGLIVSSRNAADLGRAMGDILGNPSLWSRLSLAGLKRVKSYFLFKGMADDSENIYNTLIQRWRR